MTLFADNMPFASQQMQNFATTWGFEIVTSSPDFPQSNGQAECSIQTVKALFRKVEESQSDPHVAMLNYRATPLSDSDKSSQYFVALPFHNFVIITLSCVRIQHKLLNIR